MPENKPMRVLDLFSGIQVGGFSLGLEASGMTTVAFCEFEDFPRKVLAKHWPDIPCYPDVRELTKEKLEHDGIEVDLICGGFPCQPFSTAARGRNVDDYLSAEFARIVDEVQPRYVLAENVEKKAFSNEFIDSLRSNGRDVITKNIGANEVGADHERSRWWICAYPDNEGELSSRLHAEMALLPQVQESIWSAENYARTIRVSDGLPNRIHRLKSLGNAVVPQIPEMIGRAIMAAEA